MKENEASTLTNGEIRFSVKSFRKLPNPYTQQANALGTDVGQPEMYLAICDVKDLPDNIPMKTNPREQNLNTAVAKKIKESLLSEGSSNFYLLNRGLLLSARSARFNNYSNELVLEMDDFDRHGDVDGGHTYKTILNCRDEIEPNSQYVKLEILTGIESMFEELAAARNTSVQVKDQSIAELMNRFEPIKCQLKNEPYFNEIYFEENAEGTIDVCELLAVLRMFDIDCYPNSDSFPVTSYNGKAAHVKYYLEQYSQHGDGPDNPFIKMQPIMIDIFKLYDKLESEIGRYYKEKHGDGQYGIIKGVISANSTTNKKKKRKIYSKFGHEEIEYYSPKSFLLPILGSLRALVREQNGKYAWISDPFAMLDKVGAELVDTTIERSRSLGNNPNAAGKDKGNWKTLYQTVQLSLLDL